MKKLLFALLFILMISPGFSQTGSTLHTIVIDAGHGGKDPGCKSNGFSEKDITLSISKKLKDALLDNFPELNIILTRENDKFISLDKRAKIANDLQADLFISIHVNALPSRPKFEGSETFVLGLHRSKDNLRIMRQSGKSSISENSDEANILLNLMQSSNLDYALMFATMVENRLRNFTSRPRSVIKQAGFAVLRETTMPAVLIETGFITNENDRDFLVTEKGQNTVVIAILNAFMDYKYLIEKENAALEIQDIIDSFEPSWGDTLIYDNDEYTSIEVSELNIQDEIARETKSETTVLSESDIKKILTKSKKEKEITEPVIVKDEIPITKTEIVIPKIKKKEEFIEKPNILFYVQLAASRKPLDLTKNPWKSGKIKPQIKTENGYNKYLVAPTSSFEIADKKKLELRKKGFKTCFIVAYKNGIRIPIKQALQ